MAFSDKSPEKYDEHRLLPAGLRSLIEYADAAEPLSFEEGAQIFDAIADTFSREYPDGDAAWHADTETQNFSDSVETNRHRLAWSYMPLVVGCAYEGIRSPTRLEDAIQSGIEGLYKGIDAYAHLDKANRRAFAPFAKYYVHEAIRRQRLRDNLNTEIGKGLLNTMYAYLRAEREVGEGSRSHVDLAEIGKELEASRQTIIGALGAVATYRHGNELPEPYELEGIVTTCEVGEEPDVSPRTEVALLLLPPLRRYYIEHFYGLIPESPLLTIEEMAKTQEVSKATIRTQIDLGIADLKDILENLDSFGLDFSKWPDQGAHYFKSNLNVLTYMHRAAVPIPTDRSVQELRIIAMQDILRRDVPDLHRQIVADMYGLRGENRLTIAQLMKKYGYSSGRFSQIAKKVMSAGYQNSPNRWRAKR